MTPQLGKLLLLLSLLLAVLGSFLWLGGGSWLSWFDIALICCCQYATC